MIKHILTKIKFYFKNKIDKSMKQGIINAKRVSIGVDPGKTVGSFTGSQKLWTKNYFVKKN
jgi:hypothetical protein